VISYIIYVTKTEVVVLEVLIALFLAMIIGGFFIIVTVLYYVALAMLVLWIAAHMWKFFFGKK
tara:strand:- start:2073 stop:2261 length:189 start_codon:yes stop_codon:yes gene_type:complete